MSDTTFPNIQSSLIVPKPTMTEALTSVSDHKVNGDSATEAAKKANNKRKAAPKKTVSKDEDGEEIEEPTTPKPAPKKRVSKAKAAKSEAKATSDGEEVEPVTPTAASSKKRGAKSKAAGEEDETPAKKQKTTKATPAKNPKTATKAAPKSTFPESFEEFTEGDKLLVRMRKESKSWDEITTAWTETTGNVPGKDVLRKREMKLRAIAVEWKAGDARKLVTFKAQIDEECAAALKKLESEKWVKICNLFKAAGSDYTSPSVQKKWEVMQKKNEIDAKGVYVGPDPEEAPAKANAEDAAASGNAKEGEEKGDIRGEVGDGMEEADCDQV